MNRMKKFEEYDALPNDTDKSELISFIKKHITKTVALQSGFRDDGESHFIEYSSNGDDIEYITMLTNDGVLIEQYYKIGNDIVHNNETTSYDIRYINLDIRILKKIKGLILYGNHIDIL